MAIFRLMAKQKSKYNNVASYHDGHRFDSKLERDYYKSLLLRKRAGEIKYILRQVPFHITSNGEKISRYVCDFQIVFASGEIRFIDVKGVETEVFKMKKRLVESEYPVKICIVKKGEF